MAPRFWAKWMSCEPARASRTGFQPVSPGILPAEGAGAGSPGDRLEACLTIVLLDCNLSLRARRGVDHDPALGRHGAVAEFSLEQLRRHVVVQQRHHAELHDQSWLAEIRRRGARAA